MALALGIAIPKRRVAAFQFNGILSDDRVERDGKRFRGENRPDAPPDNTTCTSLAIQLEGLLNPSAMCSSARLAALLSFLPKGGRLFWA
jgi:hypothetical protein